MKPSAGGKSGHNEAINARIGQHFTFWCRNSLNPTTVLPGCTS
jgi:hypothetical protein